MLKATEVIPYVAEHDQTLTLPYELRQKSRLRASLDNGEEIGLMLPRGTVLRGGDYLKSENGKVILVKAADEVVSTVHEKNPTLFARACYHLGNRHVPLQIGEGWLRYLHDHVLDDMVQGLGLQVSCERAPFEPEAGAYGGGHQHHHHDHEH
jgi:urease accessory protein